MDIFQVPQTTTQEVADQIIQEFALFDQWMDKYEYLIDLGKQLAPMDEKAQTEENLIKGCQSRVWLEAQRKDRRLFFTANSDAIITKGIISLLIRVFNGRTAQEILETQLDFLDTIGLKDHLSPTRANGLVAMVNKIKAYAVAAKQSEAAEVVEAAEPAEPSELEQNIRRALKQVSDPEIGVNIVDLGMIYAVNIDSESNVEVVMTFTAPNCPMADEVLEDARLAVEQTAGVRSAHIRVTFEPPWNPSMMSPEALLETGLDGMDMSMFV